MTAAVPAPRVKCPTCKQTTLYGPGNAWRPFCSERCRRADLGAWASEQFRLATPPSAEELDATSAEGDTPAAPKPAQP